MAKRDDYKISEVLYRLSNMKVKPWEEGLTIAKFEYKNIIKDKNVRVTNMEK